MTFDKSKVCVAGLHDVPVETKGYFSDKICNLCGYVNDEDNDMYGTIMEGNQDDGYKMIDKDEGIDYWSFFYPCEEQVKQYRPYRTIEEASGIIGKVICHKLLHMILLITSIEYSDSCKGRECIVINGERADIIFQDYTFEDGTPVGVEV